MPLVRRRPLLRAAAVGGGAYAMGRHAANKQAEREGMADRQGASDAAAAAPPPEPPAGGGGLTAEDTNRLAELGRLHEQGIVTDEEFAQQKARILGM
jgi:hypothetical protein